MSGIGLIVAERQRQIEEEGWKPEHDDQHDDGSLISAAVAYCYCALGRDPENTRGLYWPWLKRYWKPKSKARNLIRAAAMLAAELDRMERAGIDIYDR